ncbi:MAG: hypothetical protein ABIH76_07065 [Candidatus Bathyarchaeota archaeon]
MNFKIGRLSTLILVAAILVSTIQVSSSLAHVPTTTNSIIYTEYTDDLRVEIRLTPRNPVPDRVSEIIVEPAYKESATGIHQAKVVITVQSANWTLTEEANEFSWGWYEIVVIYPDYGYYQIIVDIVWYDSVQEEVKSDTVYLGIVLNPETVPVNPLENVAPLVIGIGVAIAVCLGIILGWQKFKKIDYSLG